MARLLVVSLVMQMDGVVGMCGFTTCKDSEVCCCNATSGQSGFCVDAGSDASVCTGSTMCPDGETCCAKELEQFSKDDDICPGLGKKCDVLGADGLSCCGSEHGPGFAFCQTSPDYLCCSGKDYAISCSSTVGCTVTDAGIPMCKKSNGTALEQAVKDDDTCPGIGQKCETVGADGLSCCGAELGAGSAFCQTSPQFICCSGSSTAISCPSMATCEVADDGRPNCAFYSLEEEVAQTTETGDDFVCQGLNYNITCGPMYTACCGENTIAPLCMDAAGHSCCKDEDLNLAVTCAKGQKCNKGPQCTAGSVMV